MTKHIAIYVRVSTRAQDTKSQEPDLQRWIALNSDGVAVKWYADSFTGKSMDRPGWNKLDADIRAGKVVRVVVWRLDRLGRTASGLTKLFDDLRDRKVGLVSVKDALDFDTAPGRLMATVLAGVAQYETEIRGERVRAGHAVARARGRRWGGSKKGRLISVTQDQVSLVGRLRSEGKGATAIARAVGISRPSVYRLLRNQAAV